MSSQVRKDVVPVLLNEVDRAKTDQVSLQLRLESQVQEREVELLQSLKKVESVTARLKSTQEEAQGLKKQLQIIEEKLQEETVEKTRLQKIVILLKERVHFAEAERVNSKIMKEDIEYRLAATEARIEALEMEMIVEKEKFLETEFRWERKLLAQLSDADSNVFASVFVSSIGTGTFFAGLTGMALSFVGVFVWAVFTDVGTREKRIKRRLQEIEFLEKRILGPGVVEKRLIGLRDKFLEISPMETTSESKNTLPLGVETKMRKNLRNE